jgi:hypothetical protein
MKVYLCNTSQFYLVDNDVAEQLHWELMAAFPFLRKLYLVYNIQDTARVWNREKLYLVARKAFIICCQQNDLFCGKECRTRVSMACRVNRQWALNVGITAGWGRCCLRNNPPLWSCLPCSFRSVSCHLYAANMLNAWASKADFFIFHFVCYAR